MSGTCYRTIQTGLQKPITVKPYRRSCTNQRRGAGLSVRHASLLKGVKDERRHHVANRIKEKYNK